MRLSRVLLLASAAAGALSVMTALFSAWQVALPGGVAALVALVGYVAVAGRAAAPRVRWAVTAGLGLLAVVMAARLFWYPEQTAAFGWLAPFYPPLDGGGRAPGKAALLDHWQRMISRERIAAVDTMSVAITTVRVPDVSAALVTAVALSGPALLAVGTLRAAGDAGGPRRS